MLLLRIIAATSDKTRDDDDDNNSNVNINCLHLNVDY